MNDKHLVSARDGSIYYQSCVACAWGHAVVLAALAVGYKRAVCRCNVMQDQCQFISIQLSSFVVLDNSEDSGVS